MEIISIVTTILSLIASMVSSWVIFNYRGNLASKNYELLSQMLLNQELEKLKNKDGNKDVLELVTYYKVPMFNKIPYNEIDDILKIPSERYNNDLYYFCSLYKRNMINKKCELTCKGQLHSYFLRGVYFMISIYFLILTVNFFTANQITLYNFSIYFALLFIFSLIFISLTLDSIKFFYKLECREKEISTCNLLKFIFHPELFVLLMFLSTAVFLFLAVFMFIYSVIKVSS